MSTVTLERQKRSLKSRIARAYNRSRKTPLKFLLRLQGYDNTKPILLEPFHAIYFPIARIASSTQMRLYKKELDLSGSGPHLTRFPTVDREKIEAGDYADYFKFGFVRNPWERMLSCYHSKIVTKQNINQTPQAISLFYILPKSASSGHHWLSSIPILNRHMSFEEFVKAVALIPDNHTDKHIRSMHTFLCNTQGELLVDYIGHLESFNDDFQYIAQEIGLSVESLHEKSKAKRSNFRDYYNQDIWELVAKRFQKDIDLFGYSDYRL